MTKLRCKVSEKTSNGSSIGFEGTMYIDGLRPTKIARKSDGSTMYAKRASVVAAAKSIAQQWSDSDLEFVDTAVSSSKKVVKA